MDWLFSAWVQGVDEWEVAVNEGGMTWPQPKSVRDAVHRKLAKAMRDVQATQ